MLVCGSGLFRALADRGEFAAAERLKQQQLAKEQRAANPASSDTDSSSQSNPLRNDSKNSDVTDYNPRAYDTSQFMRSTGHQPAPRASDADPNAEGLTTM